MKEEKAKNQELISEDPENEKAIFQEVKVMRSIERQNGQSVHKFEMLKVI